MKQFDVILSNPPFQDSTNRKKTPHKLWIDFTLAEVGSWLTPGGLLYQVSPSSFLSPSSKILRLFKEHQTEYVNLNIGHHFPQVGSTFASYIVKNTSPKDKHTTRFVTPSGVETEVLLDDRVLYLPNDLSDAALEIHRKVMFEPERKLDVRFDYVTHHNSVLKKESSTLSKTETETHLNPVFHTNSQVWWSSLRQEFADQHKVMWTISGYTKPFYDEGRYGTTDMGYYILVDSPEEGRMLAHNLNLNLFKYVFTTAKWSGFGNETVFRNLPALPSQPFTDQELYDLFSLTPAEVEYVEAFVAKQRNLPVAEETVDVDDSFWAEIVKEASSHGYMAGVERTAERVRASAEVFTPVSLVVDLLRQYPLDVFAPGNTVLDPACGDGQFLVVAKLIKERHFGMSEEAALADLFGVDIMPDNVVLTRARLGGGTIILGNTMKPATIVDGQTENDQAKMVELFS